MAKPPSRSGNNQPQPQQAQRIAHAQQWSGPLPPPAALEQFDRIIPGGAARILTMAEAEQAHRVEMERAAITIEGKSITRGQWLGWGLATTAVVGAIWTGLVGVHWAIPCALVGVPILGAVKAIVEARHDRSDDSKAAGK